MSHYKYGSPRASASSARRAPSPRAPPSPSSLLHRQGETGKMLDHALNSKLTAPKMEIRVALLGNVSAGKTTLLNALFKDKYGEVSMKRCTAGINFFHISRDVENPNLQGKPSFGTGSSVHEARQICTEIKQANTSLRDKPKIEEKHFQVKSLGDSIVTMDPNLDDLELVVVDVPGLNESGTSQMYKDYVKENFSTFDYVMIIMDVNQGVNTDEQVGLLQFVKNNCREVRDIPVCVIVNKVDHGADEEVQEMVKEIESKVADIFSEPVPVMDASGNSIAAPFGITTSSAFGAMGGSLSGKPSMTVVNSKQGRVQKLIRGSSTDAMGTGSSSVAGGGAVMDGSIAPVSEITCVALSAEYGYIYRAASQLGKTQFFEFLDKKYVDKIGMSEFGRQWARWSEAEKIENVYQVVTDPKEYTQRLKECNFSALLKELEEALGAPKQVGIISKQIEYALDQLLKNRGAEIDFVRALTECYDKSLRVRNSPLDGEMLMKTFWRLFEAKEKKCTEKFLTEATRSGLIECMDYLLRYYEELVTVRLGKNSEEECCNVQRAMKRLVVQQIRWLGRKMRACNFGAAVDPTQTTSRKTAWGKFSTLAFHNIVESILLACSLFPRETAQHFAQELVELKYNSKLMFSFYLTENPVLAKPAPKKRAKKDDDAPAEKLPHPGWFQPVECYGGDFENPRHWGYVVMNFIQFLHEKGDCLSTVEKAEEAAKMEATRAAVVERNVASTPSTGPVAIGSQGSSAKRVKRG